jgi:hypothetical protein
MKGGLEFASPPELSAKGVGRAETRRTAQRSVPATNPVRESAGVADYHHGFGAAAGQQFARILLDEGDIEMISIRYLL